MDSPLRDLFYTVSEKIIGYLPNLFAGILLIAVGWFLGWLVKRIIYQVCLLLRLERLLRSFRWGEELSKADIRHALFNAIGNLGFFIVFLIFLNAALNAMQLTVVSNLIERGVLFFPRFFISLLIFLLGWIVAGWVSGAVQNALLKEDVPRATLIARFTKSILLLFFSAMALTELDIAKEIVVTGFTVAIITLGVITVVLIGSGGKSFVSKMVKSFGK